MYKKGSAVFLVFTDGESNSSEVDADQAWNKEFVEAVLSVPGVSDYGRYIAIKGGPKHLFFFELENADVVNDLAARKLIPGRDAATGATLFNEAIIAGDQILPRKAEPAVRGMAPYLQIGRMSVPADIESAWNHWYDNEYVAGFLSVPGLIYARRFRVVAGDVRYMTVYEFENGEVSVSPEWVRQRHSSSADSPRMRAANQMAAGSPGIYRRVI